MMLVLMTVLACDSTPPPAPPASPTPAPVVETEPPGWEYRIAAPTSISAGGMEVVLLVEGPGIEVMPPEILRDETVVTLSALKDANGQTLKFRSVAHALTHLGFDGWEVVDFLGKGQYLMKRKQKGG